jgi:SagB-type dehydrogenase family enzyme
VTIGWQKWAEHPHDDEAEPELWSLFHENSKTSRHQQPLTNAEVVARMERFWTSLPYQEYEQTVLPEPAPLDAPVGKTLTSRATGRDIAPATMTLPQMSALFHSAYGITRENEDNQFPRPFRTVPSGGALYPLELYVHTAYVDGLTAGLYHYNPTERGLRLLLHGDSARVIGKALVQGNLAVDTSMIVFITAIFERSVFKYGNRGYRFTLLEAGHVAQNLNVAATALGLACVNIGGFFDREIDSFLGLDGVQHSTVYLVGIGAHGEPKAG